MGKGIYSGGHTKIFVSDEGTSWPTAFDDPSVSTGEISWPKPEGRWSGKLSEDPPGRPAHNDELEHVILCARAYSEDTMTEDFPQPALKLVDVIAAYGGNVSWLLASPKRKERFIEALKKARERDWAAPPERRPLTKPKQGKKAKKGGKTFILKRK